MISRMKSRLRGGASVVIADVYTFAARASIPKTLAQFGVGNRRSRSLLQMSGTAFTREEAGKMIGRLVRGLVFVCLAIVLFIYGTKCSEPNAGYAAGLLGISVVLELMISIAFDTAGGVVWTLIGCEALKIIFG